MRKLALLLVLAALLLGLGTLPVRAQGETPPEEIGVPPEESAEADEKSGGLLRYIMEFPIKSMTKALRLSVESILSGTVEGLGTIYSDAVQSVAFGEYASGPSIDTVQPMWSRVLMVSAALWPLTLALVILTAARGGVAANAVGYADLKASLIEWVGACVTAAISLYVMRWAMSLSNAVADMFLPGNPEEIGKALGIALADAELITTISQTSPGSLIFMLVFALSLGFAMLTAFLFSFIARYVILFVLMSLAPLPLTLGTVPATRWLSWLWVKGLVLVLLLRPINNLLLTLAVKATANGGFIVHMFVVAGVFSIMLAVNYAVVQAVFGAIGEIAKKAKATTEQIIATATLAVGGLAAGAAIVGGAGAVAGGMASGATAAGGAGGGASGAAGAGGKAVGAAKSAAGGAARTTATAGRSASMADRVRAALNDPVARRRLGNVASVVGQGIRSTSRGPIGRAVGSVVSGGGQMMAEGGREQERALQARYGSQAQSLAGWGLNPNGSDFYDIANAQQRLEATFGAEKTRQAAEPTARMMAAAEARGYSLKDLAQQAGFPSAGAWYGRRVEEGLQTRFGFKGNSMFAPGNGMKFPQTWKPGELTAYDFSQGLRLASGLGRAGHEREIGAYADLVHAFRAKGEQPVKDLLNASLAVRQAHAGDSHFARWRPFAERAERLADKHGVTLGESATKELEYLKSIEPPLFG